jgi:cobalt-zinc-cadmium efflux system outer membrane protein
MKYFSNTCALFVLTGVFAVGAFAQDARDQKQSVTNAFNEVLSRNSTADSGVTLDLVLTEVLASNPGLQAARSRIKSAGARISQARAWDDPQAGVEFFATPITSINPLTEGMETDYFLQQMIPFPGKKGLMAGAAEANAKMTEQSALAVERNLVAETKRVYVMLYTAQRRAGVNEENQRLLDQIITSARSKYSVGRGNQGDVLKVQVELASLQNERSSLGQEVTSAAAMLNALRNLPANTAVGTVAEILPVEPPKDLDSLTQLALDSRPEILGMKYEIEMNRSELASSRREWFPDLMIKGTYKQMRDQTDQWAAMIGITIPIAPWGIGKYSGKVEETEANVKSSEESLLDMQNMIRSEVRDAYAKTQSRWQQIGRYQQTILPQTQQALEANLASYRIDKIDFLSLLDSFRMLQMFRMEYYMAVGDYLASLATLERAVGTPIISIVK